ncbi:MAG: Uncharacterized protein JWN00_5772, partial [Actinomycetia bacterium]|nr:Uncharacterized protein [Actinomycetes bacterium]
HSILLSLHRTRDSRARLRDRPQVAVLVLAEGDVAFTAHGTARVVAEPMAGAPGYAAVEITVTGVDDHWQAAFTIEAGVDRHWPDEDERYALGGRDSTLKQLSTGLGSSSRSSAHESGLRCAGLTSAPILDGDPKALSRPATPASQRPRHVPAGRRPRHGRRPAPVPAP